MSSRKKKLIIAIVGLGTLLLSSVIFAYVSSSGDEFCYYPQVISGASPYTCYPKTKITLSASNVQSKVGSGVKISWSYASAIPSNTECFFQVYRIGPAPTYDRYYAPGVSGWPSGVKHWSELSSLSGSIQVTFSEPGLKSFYLSCTQNGLPSVVNSSYLTAEKTVTVAVLPADDPSNPPVEDPLGLDVPHTLTVQKNDIADNYFGTISSSPPGISFPNGAVFPMASSFTYPFEVKNVTLTSSAPTCWSYSPGSFSLLDTGYSCEESSDRKSYSCSMYDNKTVYVGCAGVPLTVKPISSTASNINLIAYTTPDGISYPTGKNPITFANVNVSTANFPKYSTVVMKTYPALMPTCWTGCGTTVGYTNAKSNTYSCIMDQAKTVLFGCPTAGTFALSVEKGDESSTDPASIGIVTSSPAGISFPSGTVFPMISINSFTSGAVVTLSSTVPTCWSSDDGTSDVYTNTFTLTMDKAKRVQVGCGLTPTFPLTVQMASAEDVFPGTISSTPAGIDFPNGIIMKKFEMGTTVILKSPFYNTCWSGCGPTYDVNHQTKNYSCIMDDVKSVLVGCPAVNLTVKKLSDTVILPENLTFYPGAITFPTGSRTFQVVKNSSAGFFTGDYEKPTCWSGCGKTEKTGYFICDAINTNQTVFVGCEPETGDTLSKVTIKTGNYDGIIFNKTGGSTYPWSSSKFVATIDPPTATNVDINFAWDQVGGTFPSSCALDDGIKIIPNTLASSCSNSTATTINKTGNYKLCFKSRCASSSSQKSQYNGTWTVPLTNQGELLTGTTTKLNFNDATNQ